MSYFPYSSRVERSVPATNSYVTKGYLANSQTSTGTIDLGPLTQVTDEGFTQGALTTNAAGNMVFTTQETGVHLINVQITVYANVNHTRFRVELNKTGGASRTFPTWSHNPGLEAIAANTATRSSMSFNTYHHLEAGSQLTIKVTGYGGSYTILTGEEATSLTVHKIA